MSLDYYVNMAAMSEQVFGGDYVQANKIRTKFMILMEDLFKKVDLIATPTSQTGTLEIKMYGLFLRQLPKPNQ